ncbi:MAG: hypothetical protein AAGC67_13520 [Myxococcota bacterium]
MQNPSNGTPHASARSLALALSIGFALATTSCASGPPFAVPSAPEGQAWVFAFRTSSMVGAANVDIVAANARFVGRLRSGTWAAIAVDPGPVVVSRKAGSVLGSGQGVGFGLGGLVGAVDGFVVVEEFVAEPGHAYFVRFPHGKRVEPERARELMSGLDDVTPVAED